MTEEELGTLFRALYTGLHTYQTLRGRKKGREAAQKAEDKEFDLLLRGKHERAEIEDRRTRERAEDIAWRRKQVTKSAEKEMRQKHERVEVEGKTEREKQKQQQLDPGYWYMVWANNPKDPRIPKKLRETFQAEHTGLLTQVKARGKSLTDLSVEKALTVWNSMDTREKKKYGERFGTFYGRIKEEVTGVEKHGPELGIISADVDQARERLAPGAQTMPESPYNQMVMGAYDPAREQPESGLTPPPPDEIDQGTGLTNYDALVYDLLKKWESGTITAEENELLQSMIYGNVED